MPRPYSPRLNPELSVPDPFVYFLVSRVQVRGPALDPGCAGPLHHLDHPVRHPPGSARPRLGPAPLPAQSVGRGPAADPRLLRVQQADLVPVRDPGLELVPRRPRHLVLQPPDDLVADQPAAP